MDSEGKIDEVKYALLSNDNSFMGSWETCSLLTTFVKPGTTDYETIKKPAWPC